MSTQSHPHLSRSSFSRFVGMMLVALLWLTILPGAALAAPGQEMDPDARAQAKQAVTHVGAVLSGSAPLSAPSTGAGQSKSDPVSAEPGQYTASGVTITAPDGWVVEKTTDEIFSLSVPGKFVFGFLEEEPIQEFPGVFAIVLFEQQSELLATSMGDDVALEEVTRFQTDQGLPGLVIRFAGNIEGLDMTGGIYIVAAAESTYMLMVLSTTDTWAELQPDADAIAASITAANPLLMVMADEGDMDYLSEDGLISLVLPSGWQIQEIDDEDINVLLVDPDMTFVAAGKWEGAATLEDAEDMALYTALLSGTIGQENEAAILDLIMQSMQLGEGDSEFILDEASTALLGDADAPILRVGATMLNDGLDMPVIIYIDANEEGMVALMTIGNLDRILDSEQSLIDVITSITFQ